MSFRVRSLRCVKGAMTGKGRRTRHSHLGGETKTTMRALIGVGNIFAGL